jgi:hypothetical protein
MTNLSNIQNLQLDNQIMLNEQDYCEINLINDYRKGIGKNRRL